MRSSASRVICGTDMTWPTACGRGCVSKARSGAEFSLDIRLFSIVRDGKVKRVQRVQALDGR